MKKIYSFLATSALLVAGIGAVSAMPEDATPVLNPESADGWTKFSASGNSGTTFVTGQSAANPPSGSYSWSLWNYAETEKNIWLSTPKMELSAGIEYALEYSYQTWENFKISNFEIYLTDSQITSQNLADEAALLTPIFSVSDMTANKNEWLNSDTIKFTGDGEKYIIFHVSGACQGRFSIADVVVYPLVAPTPKPLAPTDLTATPDADGELSVELTWTLPVLDTDGEALTGENAITGINIYRDDEKITTLEETVTTFTDTEVTGLATGNHSYAVSAFTANGEGEKSETVAAGWVGPWAFSETTVSVSSDNPAADNVWSYSRNNTSFVVRAQSYTNGLPSESGITNSVQTWNNNLLSDINAWISSPRLDMPVGKTFKISFYYRFNPNADTEVGNLSAYMAAARASESEENEASALAGTKILDVSATKGEISSSTPWEYFVYKGFVAAETPQYLNFHISGDVCKGIYIAGLTVEEYVEKPFTPAAPTNLTATAAAAQKLEVNLSWTNPTEDIDGLAFEDGVAVEQAYIYRDESEEPVATIEGNVNSFTDSEEYGLTAGEHSYKVKVVVKGAVSDFSNEASVSHVGPATPQELPWNPVIVNLSNDEFNTLWATYKTTSTSPSWTNRPAGIFLINNNYADADSWLISAPLVLDGMDGIIVTYSLSTNVSSFSPDVEIGLVDSTEPSAFVSNVVKASFGESNQAFITIPQAEAARAALPVYRLAFRDVTATPESGYNLTLSELAVADNPNTGIAVISASGEDVEIYDLNGRRIAGKGEMEKGVYIIRSGNGKVSKIMK